MIQNSVTEKHTEELNQSNLSQFFSEELRNLHRGEKDLLDPIIVLQQAATLPELKELINAYSQLIQRQVMRLENSFTILSLNPEAGACRAIEGIILEMRQTLEKTTAGSTTSDAALVIAIQKAIHYKIAAYGSLEQLATTLGMEEVTDLLNESLKEEKDQDLLFSDIAEKRINWLAETE
jgi:ferritin-like metal-binding protein YciE